MRAYAAGRRAAALLLAIIMLALAPGMAVGEDYPCILFTTGAAQLVKAPSASAQVAVAIRAQEAVYVTGETGDYYIASYEGYSGYVLKSRFAGDQPVALTGYVRLTNGDSGAQVRALQQALEELQYDAGGVDGRFGVGTQSAVAAFQRKNSLTATGVADEALQQLLYEGKPYNAKGVKTSVKTLPPIDGWEIREGARGDGVSKLQTALKDKGYYNGKIDGVCGDGTVAAIKAFQRANKLTVDGVAGADTQNALYGAQAQQPTVAPVATSTPAPAAAYPFTAVTKVAVNLRAKASSSSARRLTVPKGASVTVTGIEGDFVKATYKKSSGYLFASYVDIPAQYLGVSDEGAAQSGYQQLSSGMTGAYVTALQQALDELGFYTGALDGKFGPGTLSAVKAAQKKNGYSQTGIATPAFQQLLFEGTPKNTRGIKTDVKVLPPVDYVATMRPGDKGEPVSTLQQRLLTAGQYLVTVTGVYDTVTTAAVRAFQAQRGLKTDGIAGAETQAALLAALPTATPVVVVVTPTPTPITAENVIVIHDGTRGLAVKRLQERLVALSYYDITPDGIYDSNDIAAVREFQRKNALKADGIAGLETQLALYADTAVSAIAPAITPTPVVSPTPIPDVHTLLKVGSSGQLVAAMQARLMTLGYALDSADGVFGTKTAKAVASFQTVNELKADGLAGEKTLTLLYSKSAKAATLSGASEEDTDLPVVTLKVGATGEAVRSMQSRLITLGYLSGGADGVFGPATYLAVKAFQTKNSLTADGIAGKATQKALASSSAKPATTSGATVPSQPSAPTTNLTFTAPNASEVRFANWYTEIRSLARSMPYAVVYDYNSGRHWNVHMFSLGKHADAEPVTAADTAEMNAAFGAASWTPRPVWIILSDGRVYMASTHNYPHDVNHTTTNNFNGHLCIHFPRDMEDAQATGPYATKHQVAILAGWEATQAMIQ